MSSQTSSLTPTWSRIIHRLSTLGVMEAHYSNAIASLVEVGHYPRHIASANEDSSQSIDGSTHWNFLNWQQGWVKRRRIHHAIENAFLFSSKNHSVFHQLRLLETAPNDCLNCLLQLFSYTEEVEHTQQAHKLQKKGKHWTQLSHILERALTHGKSSPTINLSLYTEGGLIQKRVQATQLSEHKGCFTISDGKSNKLSINSGAVSHLRTELRANELHTTLFGSTSTPLAILKHCA